MIRVHMCKACKDSGCAICSHIRNDSQLQRLAPSVARDLANACDTTQAQETKELARALPCETPEQYKICGEFLRQAQSQLKHYDDTRQRFARPFIDAKREIDTLFKPITSALREVKETLASKIRDYDQRARAERVAALAAIEKAHEQQDQLAVEHHAQALQAPPPALQGVHTRKRWTFRVVDAALVPRQYLTINESEVRNAIKSGTREVPGLEIYEETTVVVARG